MLTVALVVAVFCSATLTQPTVESSLPAVPHGERGRHRPAGAAVSLPRMVGSATIRGAVRGVWITNGILLAMALPVFLP